MEFIMTRDGSKTLFNEQIGECYHSKHGAVQESKHVFIKMGLDHFFHQYDQDEIAILEIGFGTGLNFIQTLAYTNDQKIQIDYLGIEGFPLSLETVQKTGYDDFISRDNWNDYISNYQQAFKEDTSINAKVKLHIDHTLLMDFDSDKRFDIVYFDAFATIHQPEMWSDEALAHVAKFMKSGAVFVTYAITGNLKRSMKALGFQIEKVPGAPGKREMLRATKI
ncbi:tRNA (5-methylaminomethyl-2-thiouridine)(34)-methyltransferase MnmD [Sphingobacterium sp. SRCM116780]|uniref:tRNA (5-methylaminomethyl-2-thiouridine)(34)-methyltransferase MnmD n=1 Tax=Sphingobacterium sp. SRCM116780 TaxID=2907623 RepID=UPI001F2DFDE4|nr:tRNA (5-methylaminomethyl-2-thiouridine)(34)-methyltransferase MnmD [Sphingobacterium sp. SRCM116780]UIR56297.1 tRNA (5-methylaminomethyl-2-thiouridine)(34)-methyltransferase MnmD [Sphingobacterium sp. SRCM116780]